MNLIARPLILTFLLLPLLLACKGGGGEPPDGLESPEAAVQQWLDAVSKGDTKRALAATDPDYRRTGVEGLSGVTILQAAAVNGKDAKFSGLSFDTAYEPDRTYARVRASGKVQIRITESEIKDDAVYTVQKGNKWYVTSESSAYWKAQLAKEVPVPDYVKAQSDADPSLPGQYVKPHPGMDGIPGNDDDRAHSPEGFVIPICTADQIARDAISNPLCYNSNPPTSGPHAPRWAETGFLTTAAPKEQLVHSMEHANVIIWYNTSDAATIDRLRQITQAAIAQRMLVVASPYAEMEAETIALTAWTRLDKFPAAGFDTNRVLTFIQKHSRRFNPEGF